MWRAQSDSRAFALLVVALVALAWASLAVWGASPYGSFMDHDGLASVDDPISGAFAQRLVLFSGGWLLMIAAMMLPTSLPLILLFRRMTASRQNSRTLAVLLMAGYATVWLGFGLLTFVGDLGLHQVVEGSHWLQHNSWIIVSGVFLVGGVYQFTPLKYYCLDKCRSPYAFILGYWHGRRARTEALALGMGHGLFCLGCCWSIMLLMFATGMGNLAWMLALGVVMGVEKNLPWGRKLSQPLGMVLIGTGIGLIIMGQPAGACAC